MEAISGLLGFIGFIIGIFLVVAIFSIANYTQKTNQLLRMLLKEQNPEKFELKGSRLIIKNANKKI